MKNWLGSLLFLTLVGCATESSGPEPLGGGSDCEGARQKAEQLRLKLDATSSTGEPDVLSSPTLARQHKMMQVMRSAAAQQNLRQRLTEELKFQSEYCQ
jgi:hypothetical protein